MKKRTAIGLILLLLAGLAACSGEPETEIRYLTESITTEMPATDYVTVTTFTFNEDWKITGYASTVNGEETQRVTYEFDGEGNVIKETNVSGDTTSVSEYTYTFDADGNPLEIVQTKDGEAYLTPTRTYDAEGNLKTNDMEVPSYGYTCKYTYDTDGNILSVVSAYSDGTTFTNEYTYDENGNELTSTVMDTYTTYNTVAEYDEEGKAVQKTQYYEAGSVYQTMEYVYDGNTRTVTTYNADGITAGYQVQEFDDHGNQLSVASYTSDGTLQSRTSYTYVEAEVPVE